MSFECRFAEITDHQHGALDLAKLFELSESRRSRTECLRAPLTLADRSGTALVLRGRTPLLPERRNRTIPASLAPVFSSIATKKRAKPGKLPSAHEAVIGLVEGTGSEMSQQFSLRDTGSKKVRLPYFLDRHVSAAVLKQMLGRDDEVLLRQDASRGLLQWQIVRDCEVIDLADRSVVFKLGPVQMYS